MLFLPFLLFLRHPYSNQDANSRGSSDGTGTSKQDEMCLLVYKDDPVSEPHCVYVKDFVNVCGNLRFLCINSWGPKQDFLLHKIENTLYEVNIILEKSKSTRNRLNIDSGSSSPIWSFNSSYSSSSYSSSSSTLRTAALPPSLVQTAGSAWDLAPDNLGLHEVSISQNGSDCPRISGIYI